MCLLALGKGKSLLLECYELGEELLVHSSYMAMENILYASALLSGWRDGIFGTIGLPCPQSPTTMG